MQYIVYIALYIAGMLIAAVIFYMFIKSKSKNKKNIMDMINDIMKESEEDDK